MLLLLLRCCRFDIVAVAVLPVVFAFTFPLFGYGCVPALVVIFGLIWLHLNILPPLQHYLVYLPFHGVVALPRCCCSPVCWWTFPLIDVTLLVVVICYCRLVGRCWTPSLWFVWLIPLTFDLISNTVALPLPTLPRICSFVVDLLAVIDWFGLITFPTFVGCWLVDCWRAWFVVVGCWQLFEQLRCCSDVRLTHYGLLLFCPVYCGPRFTPLTGFTLLLFFLPPFPLPVVGYVGCYLLFLFFPSRCWFPTWLFKCSLTLLYTLLLFDLYVDLLPFLLPRYYSVVVDSQQLYYYSPVPLGYIVVTRLPPLPLCGFTFSLTWFAVVILLLRSPFICCCIYVWLLLFQLLVDFTFVTGWTLILPIFALLFTVLYLPLLRSPAPVYCCCCYHVRLFIPIYVTVTGCDFYLYADSRWLPGLFVCQLRLVGCCYGWLRCSLLPGWVWFPITFPRCCVPGCVVVVAVTRLCLRITLCHFARCYLGYWRCWLFFLPVLALCGSLPRYCCIVLLLILARLFCPIWLLRCYLILPTPPLRSRLDPLYLYFEPLRTDIPFAGPFVVGAFVIWLITFPVLVTLLLAFIICWTILPLRYSLGCCWFVICIVICIGCGSCYYCGLVTFGWAFVVFPTLTLLIYLYVLYHHHSCPLRLVICTFLLHLLLLVPFTPFSCWLITCVVVTPVPICLLLPPCSCIPVVVDF